MKKRDIWLDAARGIAIVVTMYVHFMRWFLEGFSGWDFTMGDFSSFDVAFVRLIEGYLRICWVGPFVYAFFINKKAMDWDLKWYLKRMFLLFILPTIVWMMYSQSIVVRFEIIQALFVFTLLTGILRETPLFLRIIFYVITIFFGIHLFPAREHLAQTSLFWQIMVGDPKTLNYFPLLYGLPSFFWFFELYNLHFKTKKPFDMRYVKISLWISLSCIALLYLFDFPMIPRHYPPNLIEYFSSFAFTSWMHIIFYNNRKRINPKGILTLIGRYTWVHFMGHLIIGGLVFEVGGMFVHKFSFIEANLIALTIIFILWRANIYFVNKNKEVSVYE